MYMGGKRAGKIHINGAAIEQVVKIIYHYNSVASKARTVTHEDYIMTKKQKGVDINRPAKLPVCETTKSEKRGVNWKNDDRFERNNDFPVANSKHWTSGREMLVRSPGETSNYISQTSF
jgi:hypothetical protein